MSAVSPTPPQLASACKIPHSMMSQPTFHPTSWTTLFQVSRCHEWWDDIPPCFYVFIITIILFCFGFSKSVSQYDVMQCGVRKLVTYFQTYICFEVCVFYVMICGMYMCCFDFLCYMVGLYLYLFCSSCSRVKEDVSGILCSGCVVCVVLILIVSVLCR